MSRKKENVYTNGLSVEETENGNLYSPRVMPHIQEYDMQRNIICRDLI